MQNFKPYDNPFGGFEQRYQEQEIKKNRLIPLTPMGVLAPESAHARPSAQPPIDVVVQLITLSTPTRVEVELGWGCGWAVTVKSILTAQLNLNSNWEWQSNQSDHHPTYPTHKKMEDGRRPQKKMKKWKMTSRKNEKGTRSNLFFEKLEWQP
jgi:hypothetical protein